MIRLAFVIHFNRTWLGGMNVIFNLINTIQNYKNTKSKIEIILFTNSKKKIKKFKLDKNVKIIEDQELFKQNIFIKIIDKIFLIFTGKTIFLEKFLLKYKINYISHTTLVTGNKSFTKSIIWIPDFQYLYFPQFFSLKYKILKKINLKIYKNHAYKILLSSNEAKKDLKKICNISKNKILVNRFTFNLPKYNKLKNFLYLKKKYSLKKNFFYLPNQYWIHKNHNVVIQALKKIKNESDKNIFIYSSGSKEDYRHPQNFKNLFELVNKYKLQKNYIYLGLIPFIDVLSLIYHSLAVLNPSYFEGWSSTVEQAKAYNKRIILSKIKVHKEQNPKYAYYFKPDDYKKLSRILLKIHFSKKQKLTFNKKKEVSNNDQVNIYTKAYYRMILKKLS